MKTAARKAKPKTKTATRAKTRRAPAAASKQKTGKVVLLSGGNPQIAKGDGEAPVKAYIAALSDWRRDVCKRLDALVTRTVPGVKKAVRWNSPFYGVEGRGYFASYHVFNRYVKMTFFAGTSLRPLPPGGTEKSKDVRWVDVYEGALDEAQMATWVKQAAALPGWDPSGS